MNLVEYKGSRYLVGTAKSKNKDLPFIFDYTCLKKLPSNVFHFKNNRVFCGKIPLHRVLVKRRVEYINQIPTDNRVANMRLFSYAQQDERGERNSRVPRDSGISIEEIPIFMWYIPERGCRGSGWSIRIKNKYRWNSTRSKDVSLKCKFEMAKQHMRGLLVSRPELLCTGHSTLCTAQGTVLEMEYIEILGIAGIQAVPRKRNLLEEDLQGLSTREIQAISAVNSSQLIAGVV